MILKHSLVLIVVAGSSSPLARPITSTTSGLVLARARVITAIPCKHGYAGGFLLGLDSLFFVTYSQ